MFTRDPGFSKKIEEGGKKAMRRAQLSQKNLIEKISDLPPEKVAEVEDFVDFLRQRIDDRQLTQAAMKLSENSFKSVWDNPDDAAYDNL